MKAVLNRLLTGRSAVIGIPYLWLLIFFLFPFLIVMKISVSEMETVTFKDIITYSENALALTLRFTTYMFITQDDLYYKTYLSSLKYAAVTTFFCLLIGYPFSYFMARCQGHRAACAADAGDVALLDLVPAAGLCVEGSPERERLGARSAGGQRLRSGAGFAGPDLCALAN